MTNDNKQDGSNPFPASDNPGGYLPAHLIKPEWIAKAKDMIFFAVPVEELNRYELMAVIGYLAMQVETEQKMHRSTLEILTDSSPPQRQTEDRRCRY